MLQANFVFQIPQNVKKTKKFAMQLQNALPKLRKIEIDIENETVEQAI